MRVCHVTTFWPVASYGFTYYTDALIHAMRKHRPEKHFVAAQRPSEALEIAAYQSIPCFSRDEDYVEPVTATVKSVGADVAVLQYANDLFGDDERFPRLVARLEESGVRTVVNSHSVYPHNRPTRFQPGLTAADFDRAVGSRASCMMVHSQRMARDLLERGLAPDKLAVIAHGTLLVPALDAAESRRNLGIPESAKVVLFFGFIWPGKGLDFLLDAFADAAKRVPDAYLYIGGYTRKKVFYTRAYMAYLRARIWSLGIGERTLLWGDFVPKERVATLFSAADLVAFPYRQEYSSVSGVLHEAVGMGRLVLCSRIAKFDEVEQGVGSDLVADPRDRNAWSAAIVRLLTDEPRAADARARIRSFAEATRWEAVARRHLDLYDAILRGEAPATALAS